MQKSEIAAQKPYLLESVFVNSVNNRIKFVQKGEIAAQKTYFCIFSLTYCATLHIIEIERALSVNGQPH